MLALRISGSWDTGHFGVPCFGFCTVSPHLPHVPGTQHTLRLAYPVQLGGQMVSLTQEAPEELWGARGHQGPHS